MSKEFGVFGVNDARLIRQRVLGDARSTMSGDGGDNVTHQNRYYGVLTENLAAATNPYAGWTSAEVRILRYTDRSSRNMEPAPGDNALLEVINRSTSLSASSGKFVIIEQVGLEWSFIWVDC